VLTNMAGRPGLSALLHCSPRGEIAMTGHIASSWITPSELDIVETRGAAKPIADALRRDLVVRDPGLPAPSALYNPAHEKDSCGVGFVADMKNRRSHSIVSKGLDILRNLVHRGAVGADPKAGDGCGMLTQIPHRFFKEECAKLGFALPEPGHYAVGQFFLPRDPDVAQVCRDIIEKAV
jgi:glutamate synthase (NADPH) large chain